MELSFNEYLNKLQAKINTVKDKNGTVDTAEYFNRFTLDIAGTINRFDQKSITEIAEKWAKDAKDNTLVRFLDEMGKHEQASDFLWDKAREEAKAHQTSQKELDSVRIVSE
jgi:hypothetical protein